jgi:uncharacterized repeat protein (TIGR01451 family)
VRHAKFRGLTLATLAAALMFMVGVPSATAVHDLDLFELDENAVAQATPGDDWETLAGGGGSALLDTFVTDPVETPADDIFDGGQTKDTENLDEWFWKGAEPNDKNDIEHAFAAAYEHQTTDDLILYFGLDRMDNSGDAAAGFWFLKKPVEQKTIDSDGDGDTENVFVFEGTNTLATHSVGDTLVQTDFTKGGSIERIEAYQWGVAPTGDPVQPGSPLRNISSGADCDGAPAGDNLCGQVNRNSETVPTNWPEQTVNGVTDSYFFKGPGGIAASANFPTATFFEGGINATKLLGADFCAAQVLAETRQSQSETSVLEDKAEAAFNLCAIDVTKTGPEKSKVGDDATYTIKVTNTGAVTLYKQSIVDDVIGDLTANAGCDEDLDPGESCTITVDHTVQAGDPDPLVNTVEVIYNRMDTLTGDEVTDSASHSVNLFQPAVKVTKGGDTLSKVGDQVTYTFEVENTGSSDSPNLILDSINDTVLGNLADDAPAACDSLAPGAKCSFNVNYTIQGTDPDPLNNTVTVHYHPDGFPNDITANDSHSVNLFQPSITLTKTGDELSKIGDKVDYTITLSNTSSNDTPDLICTISDPAVGVSEQETLASGASKAVNVDDFVIPANAADPFPNEATATCSPQGFPNVLEKKASHNINLFQPNVDVEKDCDEYTKAGDTLNCTITITNTSSNDTPDLIMGQVTDRLVKTGNGDTVVNLGDLLAPANPYVKSSDCSATLVDGATCTITVAVTVPEQSPTPDLTNQVTVLYHPDGFPNDITDSDSVDIDTLHPAYTVVKDCRAGTEPVAQEGPALFTITITNTGDADLVITADDGIGQTNLAAGQSKSFEASVNGPFSGQATVENTVHTSAVLAAMYGLPNEYAKEASGDCRLGGRVNVVKTTQGGSAPVGGWTFKLYSGPDGFDGGTLLATDNTPPDTLDFGNVNLDPQKTYTVCEENVPAGWTSMWKVDTNADGTADTIINPYNPNADDNPAADVGNRCIDFGAATDFAIPAGGTLVFQVDNSFPGGEPRTPGYWKNWSSCTGGGQYQNAINRGGGPAGFWTLDELLNNPGFTIGSMVVNGVWNDDQFKFQNAPRNNDCVEAVRILDKSDAKDGKKKASDAAYELATALLAAKLNFAAGAETCQAAQNAANAGQTLLASISFTGTGSYLPSTVKGTLATKRAQALALAKTLDQYNNGNVC